MKTNFKILIIEDTESDFQLLSRYLSKAENVSFSLTHIETRREFDDVISKPWDAILSDYNVPSFGASIALKILKEKQLDIPLIVLSGEVGEERAVELMHLGADDFVRKDNLARLIPALERSIQVSQMRKRKVKLRAAHEQALLDRERIMDVVCHDIKNPLSSIRIASQLLIERSKDGTKIESEIVGEIAEAILRSSDRVNRLVRDILDQSRIESGSLGISSKKVPLNLFMKEVADAFLPIARNVGVTLSVSLEEESLEGFFDRDRVFQVISNLISNAIKFTPSGGTVDIEGRKTNTGLCFKVIDSGTGIAQQDKTQIFSKFFQGTKSKLKGHGLGLWIAQEIVKAHGGEIGFEVGESGKGTTFWFTIPSFVSLSPAALPIRKENSQRVLIVDDDEDLTLFISKVLASKKVSCKVADGFDSAIEVFNREKFNQDDVLLVDYDLPKKNGGQLIEWLRSQKSPEKLPKMVLMSAHPDIDVRAKSFGVKHYLRKPMNIDEIYQVVTSREGMEQGAS